MNLSKTNAVRGSSKHESARAGTGHDDELDVELRIGPCRLSKSSSATALRSSDCRKTNPRPAKGTRGIVSPPVLASCARCDTESRLITFGVEKSATAIETTARIRGSDGGGSNNPATRIGKVSKRAIKGPSAILMVAVDTASRYSFDARVMYSTKRSAAKRVWQRNRYPSVCVETVAEKTWITDTLTSEATTEWRRGGL